MRPYNLEPRNLRGAWSQPGCTKRPHCATPLREWLDANHMGVKRFAALIGANQRTVQLWSAGQVLPSLPWAFRIDAATKGAVSPGMWLGTELGRIAWGVTFLKLKSRETAGE